jgi:hypothetical protein
MDDFIVNNEKKKHSSYGMKSFIPWDECFLHFIINNEIIHRFWDSVFTTRFYARIICTVSARIVDIVLSVEKVRAADAEGEFLYRFVNLFAGSFRNVLATYLVVILSSKNMH